MKTKLLVGAAMAALLAASGASAQETGWYGAVDLGVHFPQPIKAAGNTIGPNGGYPTWQWRENSAFLGDARLGYQFHPNWRVEAELGYRDGRLTSVNPVTQGAPLGLTGAGGQINDWTYMANLIYDFMPDSKVSPFFGVGGGAETVNFKTHGFLNSTPAPYSAGEKLLTNSASTVAAFQITAGMAWRATSRIKIDLTYHYLDAGNPKWATQTVGASPILALGSFKGDYQDHAVTLGLRYSFAPPPPPVQAKEFIVYFPFDQSALTPEAQSIVQMAADYSKQGNATKIVVVGHTDTSGSVKYNVKLSERRAKTVADALVAAGVQQSVLSVDWKGKSEPAVQTGDGVKEPLNRRATININF